MGSQFLQFIPIVERVASPEMKAAGYGFARPPLTPVGTTSTSSPSFSRGVEEIGDDVEVAPTSSRQPADSPVTPWSVESEQYGTFLCAIFDEWVRHDVGKVFVQLFDVALGNWMGLGSSLCVFAEKCGAALAIEHNGDVYSCDHYVYPKYRLGNIMNQSLGEMVHSPAQTKFGNDKFDSLPRFCREVE